MLENWLGELDDYAQSVDQRVKMSGWLELFENRGGKVVYHGVTTYDLDGLTNFYDLVIIAAGKGELVQLFDRDPSRSPYSTTQRILAVVYVHGMTPRPEHPTVRAVRFNAVPGVGELFIMPCFTVSGPCDILFWEAVPGGPLDRFTDRLDPAEQLKITLDLARQYMPWVYERCQNVELTDGRATLSGRYTPTVRRPVAELPSGGLVLGMADVVVTTPSALAYVSGPASVASLTGLHLSRADLGGAAVHARLSGLSALSADDDDQAISALASVLD